AWPESALNLPGAVAGRQNNVTAALVGELIEQIGEEGPAGHRRQHLGTVVHDGPQPRPLSADQNNCSEHPAPLRYPGYPRHAAERVFKNALRCASRLTKGSQIR